MSEVVELDHALTQTSDAQERLQLLERLTALHRVAPLYQARKLAELLHELGHAQREVNEPERAAQTFREAAGLLPGDVGKLPILLDLGGLLCSMQNGVEAESPLLEAVDLLQRDGVIDRRTLWAYNLLGSARVLAGRDEDALASLQQAAATARQIAVESKLASAAAELALMLNNVARAELVLGRSDAACSTLEAALAVTRELLEARGSNEDLVLHSAVANRYGRELEMTSRSAQALPFHEEAAEIMRRMVTHGREDLAGDLADVEADLARLKHQLEHEDAALDRGAGPM